MRRSVVPLVLAGVAVAVPGAARAASSATFVSGTGVDSGACTEAAPCRTFRFALNQTRPGGLVTAVTSGSFGPVITTKPISVVARGVTALIETTISCGSSARAAVCILGADGVTLRGLTIDLHQTSASNLSGIRFNSGGALHVQNCAIRGAGGSGIDFEPTSSSSLYVSDTALTDNQGDGIVVSFTVNGNSDAKLDHVRAENNVGTGLGFVNSNGALNGVVTNSVFAGNHTGIAVAGLSGAGVNLTIDRTTVATNSQIGVSAFANPGIAAIVRIGNSTIAGNATGVEAMNSASMLSFGTNKLTANGADGLLTGTIAPQ